MVLRTAILFSVCSVGLFLPLYLLANENAPQEQTSQLGERVWQTDDPAPLQIEPTTRIVNIGVGPWLNRLSQATDFEPILRWVEESTGYDCVLNISPNYESLNSDLVNGYIDVAILSAAAYSNVLSMPDVQTHYIATVIAGSENQSNTYYRGYIFTHEDSSGQDLNSLKGKPFAFVDRGSSSGFQYPMALMLEAGIVPSRDFKSVFYLGSHDRVVSAVADKQVYAGAVWDDTLTSAQAAGKALKIMAKTGPIPREAWVAGSKVEAEVVEKIQAALVSADLKSKTKNGQLALKGGYLYSGFKVESPQFYKGVQTMKNVLQKHGELLRAGSGNAK